MPCETEVSISRHLKYASSAFLAAALMASPLIAIADSHGIGSSGSNYQSDTNVCNVGEISRRQTPLRKPVPTGAAMFRRPV